MFFKNPSRLVVCSVILLGCMCIYCLLTSTAYKSIQHRFSLARNCPAQSDIQHLKTNASLPDMTQFVSKLRSDILLHRSLDSYFIPRETKVNVHNYSFLITAEKLCEKASPYLLIVVHSLYDHVEAREIIRKSWGSVVQTRVWVDSSELPNIKLIFLIAIKENVDVFGKLQQESFKYGDIVLVNFIDTYRNLTIKTMSALQWTIKYCPEAKYLLKNDEDVIVVLPRLLKLLKTIPLTHLLGRQGFQTNVPRDSPVSKWIVDKKEYPLDFYPPYILGSFYVIPNAAVPVLYQTSQYIPIITMEDVFITGVVRFVTGFQIEDVGEKKACWYKCDLYDQKSLAFTVGVSSIRHAWETLGEQRPDVNVNTT